MKSFYDYSNEYMSNGEKSYLVISIPLEDKMKEYQISMIEKNTIGMLLPMSVQRVNDEWRLYYDITSRIPFCRVLERKVFNTHEFEHIIMQFAKLIREVKDYLMDIQSVVMDKTYVYCEPSSLALYFLYLPVATDEAGTDRPNTFLKKLLVEDIRLSDDASGSLLKRLLEVLKQENISCDQLFNCIKPPLLKQQKVTIQPVEEKENIVPAPLRTEENKTFRKVNIPGTNLIISENRQAFCNHNQGRAYNIPYVILGLVNLVILGILLYTLLKGSKDPGSTIMGLLLIAGALNYFLVTRLFSKEKKAMESDIKDNVRKQPLFRKRYVNEAIHGNSFAGKNMSNTKKPDSTQSITQKHISAYENKDSENLTDLPGDSISDTKTKGSLPINNPIADKTMILGGDQCQVPYLQSHRCPSEKIILDRNSILIGRLTDSVDYVIQNSAVGKIHAEIIKEGGEYRIIDLNSVNGTYVNDGRIVCNTETLMNNGDKVTLANESYTFKKLS